MKIGNRKNLALYSGVAIVNAILAGIISIQFGNMTNFAVEGNFDLLVKSGILVGGVTLIQIVIWTLQNHFIKNYMKASVVSLKENYMGRILKRHRLSYANAHYISHLTNDADRLEQQHFLNIVNLVSFVTTLIVSTTILARINLWFLALVALLAVIFYFMAQKTSQPVKKEEKTKSIELERYTHFIDETLDGFAVIKSHQFEDDREKEFNNLVEQLRKRQYQLEKKISIVEMFNGSIQGLIIACLTVFGMMVTSQAGFSLGQTMMVVLMVSDILWPLQRFTPVVTEITAMQSVFESFDDALDESEKMGENSLGSFENIQFSNAQLGYDRDILSGVNLEINRGEKVLIIGPSGAGKSTVLKTLLRDIDALGGTVECNSKALKTYDLDDYNEMFSVVDQIGFIFSGTIQENISMLDYGDVTALLKTVNLGHLNQNDVLKNNGDTLSGGERARILLARSQYFNKEVVVCDEILSSLDARVAQSIERDILEQTQTLINVSHIMFKDNLDCYDKFVIVDHGSLTVSDDPKVVIKRMLESDVEIK